MNKIREIKAQPWRRHRWVTGARCEGSYSVQSVKDLNILTAAQLNTIRNSINTSTGYTDTLQFLVQSADIAMILTNQSKANVFVDIYEFIYRQDTTKSFVDLCNDGIADTELGGVDNIGTYGTTPFMGKIGVFCKVQKITKVELGQGRSHRHSSKYLYNDIFEAEMLGEGFTVGNFAGWTRGICLICRGTPDNDSTTKTNVVSSSTAVDIIWEQSITYKYSVPVGNFLSYTMSLPKTGITEEIMDVGSGDVELVTVA